METQITEQVENMGDGYLEVVRIIITDEGDMNREVLESYYEEQDHEDTWYDYAEKSGILEGECVE